MLEQIAEKLEKLLLIQNLEAEWKPGYLAIASNNENDSEIFYTIDYYKTIEDMPPYLTETFSTASDCVKEMVKISITWTPTDE